MRFRRLCVVLPLALATLGLTAAPAQAATTSRTTTGSCVDGGGVTWHTKVVWGSSYVAGDGVTRVAVDYAGWTSTVESVPTDSSVKTYDATGRLIQTLTHTATVNYRQGSISAARNPANPPSGGARVLVALGRDGDGFGGCSISHAQSQTQAQSADPVVAAVGDIACSPGTPVTAQTCQQQAVSDSILAAAPAAFLPLGDNQYPDGTLAQYRGSYHPSYGRLKATTSPTPGNHEYNTSGAAGYFDYFGTAAGLRSKAYYSFDVGAWHVVSLNSERDIAAAGVQLTWLKNDLAAAKNPCTMAILHKPRFSSGEHGDDAAMKPFVDALVAGRAELLLAGHDHHYERFAPQTGDGSASSTGVTEIVTGTGGKSLYDVNRVAANSVSRSHSGFGWLKLTLHPTSADVRYVPVAGNTFSDQKTIACR